MHQSATVALLFDIWESPVSDNTLTEYALSPLSANTKYFSFSFIYAWAETWPWKERLPVCEYQCVLFSLKMRKSIEYTFWYFYYFAYYILLICTLYDMYMIKMCINQIPNIYTCKIVTWLTSKRLCFLSCDCLRALTSQHNRSLLGKTWCLLY